MFCHLDKKIIYDLIAVWIILQFVYVFAQFRSKNPQNLFENTPSVQRKRSLQVENVIQSLSEFIGDTGHGFEYKMIGAGVEKTFTQIIG